MFRTWNYLKKTASIHDLRIFLPKAKPMFVSKLQYNGSKLFLHVVLKKKEKKQYLFRSAPYSRFETLYNGVKYPMLFETAYLSEED